MIEKEWEYIGYGAIGLTILGQFVVGANLVIGQLIWLAANVFFLAKALALKADRAEVTRNIVMSGVTVAILGACALGIYS